MELVGPVAQRMWVSTFHAACVRILRAHADRLGYRSSFTIYDDADSRRLVEHVLRDLNIDAKRLPPRSVQAVDLGGQVRAHRLRDVRRRGHVGLRAAHRRCVPGVPAAPGRRVGHGLRRPAPAHGAALRAAPGRARGLPGPLPPRARRRVPGHQPGPERDRAPARRRAPRHLRGGRQRPVDLRLAGCGHPQHPGVRRGLPRRHRRPPGAELPLDQDHPRRRQRRHRQQRHPCPQGAVDRRRRRRADRALPGRGRVRRGRLGGHRDRPAARVRRRGPR